jgi:hypothetical protein
VRRDDYVVGSNYCDVVFGFDLSDVRCLQPPDGSEEDELGGANRLYGQRD